MKNQNKENCNKLQRIIHQVFDFRDFIRVYKIYIAEKYSFLVNYTTLFQIKSDNPLRCRKNNKIIEDVEIIVIFAELLKFH